MNINAIKELQEIKDFIRTLIIDDKFYEASCRDIYSELNDILKKIELIKEQVK